jgi:Tetratricopeptide repeat
MDRLYPAEAESRPRVPAPATAIPALTDPDTARTWLATERPTLVTVAAYTATHGWPTHTTRLSTTLCRYLDGGYSTDALTIHSHACQAALLAGDPTGDAHALINLGWAYLRLCRYRQAADQFEQALDLCRSSGDAAGEARALRSLGVAADRLGDYHTAAEHFTQVLAL